MTARLQRPGREAITHPYNTEPSPDAPLPAVSRDLLDHLEKAFPNRLPPPGSPYEEVQRAWGRRDVVDHLTEVHRQIEEEQKTSDVLIRPQGPRPD